MKEKRTTKLNREYKDEYQKRLNATRKSFSEMLEEIRPFMRRHKSKVISVPNEWKQTSPCDS